LAKAEAECLADEEPRRRRRERNAERRAELDEQYVVRFAQRIRAVFPSCPAERERTIAEFPCVKYSGRVGRSAAAKQLDEDAVRLAAIAHLRHVENEYDTLLSRGLERYDARQRVRGRIEQVLADWETRNTAVT
jgi:hypothetical protein